MSNVIVIRIVTAIGFMGLAITQCMGTKDYSKFYYDPGQCVVYRSMRDDDTNEGILRWVYASPYYEVSKYLPAQKKYSSSNETIQASDILWETSCK